MAVADGLLENFDPENVGEIASSEPQQPAKPDLLSSFDPEKVGVMPEPTSATGAFVHAAERGALPAAGGLIAAGAGAEIGAGIGALGGPAAPVTVPAGAIIGGLAGFMGGATAVEKVQSWGLQQLPDSWKEAIGLDERQGQMEAEAHPTASFLGGLAPYALTMQPGKLTARAAQALPENATAFQRIIANPITGRLFGGGLMGGMELGQELVAGHEHPDWTNVAIATGFGLVFNKPTRLGERLTGIGAAPVRAIVGRETVDPTIAEVGDAKVMGPGVTEEVFLGDHQQAPESTMTAQEAARTESSLIGDLPEPDLHGVARRMEPELFDHYDALAQQREQLRSWIDEMRAPGDDAMREAAAARDAAQEALNAHLEARGGYTGGSEARRLRADLREAQRAYDGIEERRGAAAEGRAEETEEMALARQHLMAVDYEMRDVGREVAAAYRRAAEHRGVEMVEPEKAPVLPPVPEGHVRFFHGGIEPTSGGSRWVTPDYEYARNYRGGPNEVHYVDVPKGHQSEIDARLWDDQFDAGTNMVGRYGNIEIPEELARQLKPAVEPKPSVDQVNAQVESAASAARPIEEQRAFIADDVKRQLVAAGRSEEEARAAGQLVAARYATRANLFKGALGTPEELYRREGAEIRGPGGAAPAPVPGEPTIAAAAQPAVDEPIFIGGKRVEGDFAAKLRDRIIEREAPELVATAEETAGEPIFIGGQEVKGPLAAQIRARLAAAPAPEPVQAPLMPTMDKPEIAAPAERVSEGGGIEALDPATIEVDAERFQFKAGGDAAGVTERLQGIEKWDPRLAGTALVWRDAGGKNWIADGHQRLGLAKRLSETQPDIKVNAFVLDAKEGITDSDARVIAAVKNIAEGSGTSIDAAKIMKEAEGKDIDLPPLPPRSALVREGQALARLSPEAFGMVVNDVVPTGQAALVGKLVADPLQQVEALRVLAKAQPDNLRQAEMIVREILATGTEEKMTQGGLFGEEAFAESVVLERARIADEALKMLKRDKSTFRTLVNEAEGIQSYGRNALNVAANQERLTADEQASQFLSQLATRKGPVSDELTAIARRLKSEEISRAEAGREFVKIVRREIEGGLVEGADAGGAVAGAAGERPEVARELLQAGEETKFEPGAEGKPQQLIPGVEPVTDRQRAELAANKPLKGGAAAPPEGGLFDEGARDQTELFQRDLAPMFRSAVADAVAGAKQEKASPEQWLATIKNTLGVKAEEMKWLGLAEWLKEQQGPVTRAQIAEYVRANSIEVHEIEKGEMSRKDFMSDKEFARIQELREQRRSRSLTNDEMSEMRGLVARNAPTQNLEGGKPKHSQWRLPGGENYRELLLTLPPEKRSIEDAASEIYENFGRRGGDPAWEVLSADARRQYLDQAEQNFKNFEVNGATYTSSHWDEPNIVSHIRFDDRTGPNGEKVLHIAEVQSDWHQAGRKRGYDTKEHQDAIEIAAAKIEDMRESVREMVARNDDLGFDTTSQAMRALQNENPAQWDFATQQDLGLANSYHNAVAERRALQSKEERVPDAPFKTTWPELAMKRMIRYAAENGYERISWDTGAVNADRYDLSKQVDHLLVKKNEDGTYKISAQAQGRGQMVGESIAEEKLEDYVGKDVAKKIVEGEGKETNLGGSSASTPPDIWRKLSGVDLKVGGEGMVGFYDKILPAAVNKLVKKFGAKTESSSVDVNKEGWSITPPEQTTHGKWMVKSSDYNSKGMRFETEAEAKAALAEKVQKEPVYSIELTPELADAALYEGFPLFQGARGKIRLAEGNRPIITLMRDANASTFIHETGHDWLEQLLRDSAHEAAPSILKDDATTVLDWLGARSAEDLKTRHHEKFARGFEQYMREGVAPSKELAGVFAKFKNWLVQIYQTIKGLGAPINDDIRGVFDRMLAEEPSRTVVAPERESQPSIIDIHETDAKTIEPHEAEAAADRIAAERARYVSEPPPEIQNEIAPIVEEIESARAAERGAEGGAEPGGDAGAGGVRPGEVVGGGEEPRPVAKGGGMGARGGEERESGTGTEGQGGGLPREQTGADRLSPRPAYLFGPKESQFLDRAGNIRVENLTTREDVAQAIHDAADANNDFIGDRRGKITDGQVMELADALGMTAESLNRRRIGQAFNAEQIVAARRLLVQSATNVAELMRKAATGTDEEVLLYAQARDRHQMIQAQVAGITAEAGRALRAFRDISRETDQSVQNIDQFLRTATGKTLFQLRQEAQLGLALETPEQVSKFMHDARGRSFGRMILEYWINGLISGPKSQATYSIGNTLLSIQNFGPETALAAVIGRARQRMGREGETVRIGEVAAAFQGAREGFAPALKAAGGALRTGVSSVLPGEKAHLTPFETANVMAPRAELDEAYTLAQIMSDLFGTIRGMRDGIIAGAGLLKAGGVEGAPVVGASYTLRGEIPNIAVRGVDVLPVGELARLPSRMNAMLDSFFRAMNYSMEKNAQAYRMAENEGLTGTALDARIADLRANPTLAMMERARVESSELSLLDKGGEFTQAVSRFMNTNIQGVPVLKFIAPFVRVASNTIEQSIIRRTPFGLFSEEIRADLSGRNGTIAQDKTLARMLAGTALSVTFGGLAAEGLISGSGPKDPKESAVWRLAGNQAHSVRIGDFWYDVRGLGPQGMLMGVAADLYDVAHKASDGDFEKAAAMLHHAFMQNILDQSFMKGPADLIKAVESPDRFGQTYIRNFLSSFVPYSVAMGQIARSVDPYSRQARSVADAIKAKVPGLSEELRPRRDIWGEAMPNRESAFGFTTMYATQANSDPVNQALLDAGYFPAQPPRKIRNVDLTDEQYDDFQRISGRAAKMRLDTIVRSQQFQTWPKEVRHELIQETVRQSREMARNAIMAKDRTIPLRAYQQKVEGLRKGAAQ